MNQSDSPYALQGLPNPNAVLKECQEISYAIDRNISRLKPLETSDREEEAIITYADILKDVHKLADRIKCLKSRPESYDLKNKAQVDRLGRLIREALVTYRQSESTFRQNIEDQKRRKLRIVKPGATEDEINEVINEGVDIQVFQQALLNSNRRGEAQNVLSDVRGRHDAIQQIEQGMVELQQIFEDLDTIVKEQEPVVQQLEQKATDTDKAMERGNAQLDGAIAKAKAARKRKWICFGVCVFIIFVIVVVILVWAAFTGRFVSMQGPKFSRKDLAEKLCAAATITRSMCHQKLRLPPFRESQTGQTFLR